MLIESIRDSLLHTIFNSIFVSNDVSNELSEFRCLHSDVLTAVSEIFELLVSEHANVKGSFASGAQVIARDHMQVNARLFRFSNHVLNALSDGVTQNDQGQESLVLLESVDLINAVNFTLHRLHQVLEVVDSHIAVGESHSTH